MSNTKKHRGQDQVVFGSPTGHYHTTDRYDYSNCGDVKYYGTAKHSSPENSTNWYIELFEYDSAGNVTAIKIASNKIEPTATSVIIDTASNPGLVRIEIVGGDFFPTYLSERDKLELNTPSNHLRSLLIEEILSDTEILVKDPKGVAVDETTSVITNLTLELTNMETTKDFHQRRWDLRDFYVYE